MPSSAIKPPIPPHIAERPDAPPESKLSNGFLLLVMSRLFQELRLAASLCREGLWFPIHEEPNIVALEFEHGTFADRGAYNQQSLVRAAQSATTVVGKHAGCQDLFIPIVVEGRVDAFVVTGPYFTRRPTGPDILERWQTLTGRQGRLADPEFARYLDLTLSTLVVEPEQQAAFQRLLECVAGLTGSDLTSGRAGTEIEALSTKLIGLRFAERVWNATGEMVDERTSRGWGTSHKYEQRRAVGLSDFPEHVLVGLSMSRTHNPDPLDELLRRHALQRACVELGKKFGDSISGQVGSHGVSFLVVVEGSTSKKRRRLVNLAEKAASLAKKEFGLTLHFGLSTLPSPLPEQYQAALAAAESALSTGRLLLDASASAPRTSALAALRDELAQAAEEKPSALTARFDAFLEAVAARCSYRREPAAVHLEIGFERLTKVLLQNGALDPKGLASMQATLESEAGKSGTITELFATYRRAVGDLADAVERPGDARHERSLRRAEEYVREHFGEPLSVKQVARIAGFAPSYFFELFHKRQGVTFVKYLTQLRIGRAKELLSTTSLTLQRVAELSGLSTQKYLSRVFKRAAGETPIEYRARTTGRRKTLP